ncbi:MAG: sigma-70 family RNA polymerase sigma factor [Candidatus Berkelbacteria bacterium]|nr:sigma-70 family RNA polymerase sigma factor [Candidatus Berkelbacteria bacterium]
MSVETGISPISDIEEKKESSVEKNFGNKILFEKLQIAQDSGNETEATKTREKIIEYNKPLAFFWANKFGATDKLELGDIESAGLEGLIFAVDHFDRTRGNDFGVYASPCIEGQILRVISKSYPGMPEYYFWSLKKVDGKSDFNSENLAKMFSEREEIIKRKLERKNRNNQEYQPTEDEIAEEFAREVGDRLKIYRFATRQSVSLDEKQSTYSPDEQGLVEFDREVAENYDGNDPVEVTHRIMLAEQIEKVLETIPWRMQFILAMTFGATDLAEKIIFANGTNEQKFNFAKVVDNPRIRNRENNEYTLLEVGNIFDLTPERIIQIRAKALKILRHPGRNKRLRDYVLDEPKKKK